MRGCEGPSLRVKPIGRVTAVRHLQEGEGAQQPVYSDKGFLINPLFSSLALPTHPLFYSLILTPPHSSSFLLTPPHTSVSKGKLAAFQLVSVESKAKVKQGGELCYAIYAIYAIYGKVRITAFLFLYACCPRWWCGRCWTARGTFPPSWASLTGDRSDHRPTAGRLQASKQPLQESKICTKSHKISK